MLISYKNNKGLVQIMVIDGEGSMCAYYPPESNVSEPLNTIPKDINTWVKDKLGEEIPIL